MIEYKQLANGFPYITICNDSAEAKIALQGAHLFHYQRHQSPPLLWLSETSNFAKDKAIRGGVPICWPWFGKHPTDSSLPQHGFARLFDWKVHSINEMDASLSELNLQLKSSNKSLQLWPHPFELLLQIRIGSTLELALTTTNSGDSAFELSSALHSYFAVSDITECSISGLEEISFFNALTKNNAIQRGTLHITEETDRIYQNISSPIILKDREKTVRIESKGSTSAVIWNPWIEKSRKMADVSPDGYKTMLCIETANALTDSRLLAPGDSHTLQCTIE